MARDRKKSGCKETMRIRKLWREASARYYEKNKEFICEKAKELRRNQKS